MAGMVRFLLALAYITGIGLGIGTIYKFKQHRDNPTQIPLCPCAFLFVSIFLVFLPSLITPGARTIFGGGTSPVSAGPDSSGATMPGYHGGRHRRDTPVICSVVVRA